MCVCTRAKFLVLNFAKEGVLYRMYLYYCIPLFGVFPFYGCPFSCIFESSMQIILESILYNIFPCINHYGRTQNPTYFKWIIDWISSPTCPPVVSPKKHLCDAYNYERISLLFFFKRMLRGSALTGLIFAIKEMMKMKRMKIIVPMKLYWKSRWRNLIRCSWIIIENVAHSATFILAADKSLWFWYGNDFFLSYNFFFPLVVIKLSTCQLKLGLD